MNRFITIIAFLTGTATCSAQSFCEQLTLLKKEAYGFKPSTMTRKAINERLVNVDKFWDLAKTNKPEAEECLKGMILSEKDDLFFCYDASVLLAALDSTRKYLDVEVEGLKKVDLDDIQLDAYLDICFFLANNGKDVTALAEKLISYPNAHIFLINHAIVLNGIEGSLFLYNILGTAKTEESLFREIATGTATAKHNAAVLLNWVSTAKGDSLLDKLMAGNQLADSTIAAIKKDRVDFVVKTSCSGALFKGRDAILQRLKNFPGVRADQNWGFAENDRIICTATKLLQTQDIEVVRAARNRSTTDISDESLGEYFALTKILMTIRNK